MKHLGIKKIKVSISLILLSLLALTGCGDSSSKSNKDSVACANQVIPVGIVGNTVCPYIGEVDANGVAQPYALHYSGSFGVGFDIKLGWKYKDDCPQDGQLAVYQNGQFSYCTGVNPEFARTDFTGHTENNMGECAGEQYNMDLTGCRPDLKPSNPQYNW